MTDLDNPPRKLLHVRKLWDRRAGRVRLLTVERVDGKKIARVTDEPRMSFRATRRDKRIEGWPAVLPVEDTERVECAYRDLPRTILEVSRPRMTEKQAAALAERTAELTKKDKPEWPRWIHGHPWLHGTDVDLEDFHMDAWMERRKDDMDPDTRLRRGFWDVEVDEEGFEGFPDPEIAPCPINAISYCRETPDGMVATGYFSKACKSPNASMNAFHADPANASALKERLAREMADPPARVELRFHENERETISAFVAEALHGDNPDVLLAWNLAFDFQTLANRMRRLRMNAERAMCPEVPEPCREVAWFPDKGTQEVFMRRDSWTAPGNVHHSDMMANYMKLRTGFGRLESYSLNAVLEAETGLSKAELPDASLRDAARKDYAAFLRYSMHDAWLLAKLDAATGDLDTLRAVSMATRTRFEKAMVKTVSLKNLHRVFLRSNDWVLGNNRNAFPGNRGSSDKQLRGAFVANPLLNERIGDEILGSKSRHLFSRVCDFDFTALYPSIISAFVVDGEALVGRPVFDDAKPDAEGRDTARRWAESVAEGDPVLAGEKWMGLPGYEELAMGTSP